MGALSRLGWERSVDNPRTLGSCSDGRGLSYDSGDAVSGVESGK